MYVERAVWSVRGLTSAIEFLTKTQREYECEAKLTFTSGFYLTWIHKMIRLTKQNIEKYKILLTAQASIETRYQKLYSDISAALANYNKNCSKHSQQRTNSIATLQKVLNDTTNSSLSLSEKYDRLSQAIVLELNAVERDHNKDTFSKIFTFSRLAETYIEVLRDNCINPNDPKYSAEIELKEYIASV
ncbi:MAG: hypothetical protein M1561_06920 [Gammaproteobacteria bacterium]|nr:hypothetical protein [Gammaproteobacteria bacterium]